LKTFQYQWIKGEILMKLFVIIKEKGELCNFYTGLITCSINYQHYGHPLNEPEIKISGALQYSQYDRIGRYKNIKDPDKFKTIKKYIYERFDRHRKEAKDVFIKRLLDLTGSSQLWVHEKSL